jgi:hypothetical protein
MSSHIELSYVVDKNLLYEALRLGRIQRRIGKPVLESAAGEAHLKEITGLR